MADDTSSAPAPANVPNTDPMFAIQRIYLKDASLEQPNAPAILAENGQPEVEIGLGLDAQNLGDGHYEAAVTATVTTRVNGKVLFLIEAKQAGIFEIRNLPDEQIEELVGIACPGIVYPYLRAVVADLCQRAGFPAVTLAEVNFQAMFAQQRAQQLAAANGAAAPTLN